MKVAAVTALFCAAIAFAFVLGARLGSETLVSMDAPYRAQLAVMYLKMLDEQKLGGLRNSLESDVGGYIYAYGNPKREWLGWLFPELQSLSEETALSYVADYFKENPQATLTVDHPEPADEFLVEHDRRVLGILSEYGYSPHNNSLKADVPDGPRP